LIERFYRVYVVYHNVAHKYDKIKYIIGSIHTIIMEYGINYGFASVKMQKYLEIDLIMFLEMMKGEIASYNIKLKCFVYGVCQYITHTYAHTIYLYVWSVLFHTLHT